MTENHQLIKFILEKKFNTKIEDGQSGCWCFRLNSERELNLTATGYEIELDILIELLKK
jgi:arylamine N-acetyltransferase